MTFEFFIWYCLGSVRETREGTQDHSPQASRGRARAPARAVAGSTADPSRLSRDTLPTLRPSELSLCRRRGPGARARLLSDGHRRTAADTPDLRPQGAQESRRALDRKLPARAREARGDLDIKSRAAEARRAVQRRVGCRESVSSAVSSITRSRYRAAPSRCFLQRIPGERPTGCNRGATLWPRSFATCSWKRPETAVRSRGSVAGR